MTTTLGMICTILGAIAGGAFVTRFGIYRGLLVLGIVQMLSNLAYALVAMTNAGRPAMYGAAVIETFCGGLGTAAFLVVPHVHLRPRQRRHGVRDAQRALRRRPHVRHRAQRLPREGPRLRELLLAHCGAGSAGPVPLLPLIRDRLSATGEALPQPQQPHRRRIAGARGRRSRDGARRGEPRACADRRA